MTATFDTMLKYFSPDHELTEVPCEECGSGILVDLENKNRKRLCPECKQDRILQSQKRKEHAEKKSFDEPTYNFVLAVISQARYDAQHGDYHALEYLRAEDGAMMLCRCAGIKLDYDAEEGFRQLGITGKNRKHK